MRFRFGQALAAAASLLSVVDAQGFYGSVSSEIAACGSDNFIYLGCFPNFEANALTYFSFSPQGFNPGDPSRSFPGFDPGSNINATITPLNCARVCRGFGYKFSALRDNSCRCGIQLPAGYEPSASAVCDVQCNGDASQTCGGGSDAQIYVDPTFAANDEVPVSNSNQILAGYYQYLGCYNAPFGFPTQDARASVLVADIDACFSLCAGMGYPLVHGEAEAGQVRCICGTTFGIGAYRVHPELLPTPGDCNATCSTGIAGDCDITSQHCCGRNNVFPIYINTELQGCYTPVIPGYKLAATDLVYECVDINGTLTGPPTVLNQTDPSTGVALQGQAALIRPPAVSVSGTNFYLYGCVHLPPEGILGGIFDPATSVLVPNISPATLEGCAAQCNNGGYSTFGMVNGHDCYCAGGVLGTATIEAMGTCRVACGDAANIACGGVDMPLVYSTAVGGIFPQLAAQLAVPSPEYECAAETTSTRTTTMTSTFSTTTSTTTTEIATLSTSTTTTDTESTTTTTTSTSTEVTTTSTTTSTTETSSLTESTTTTTTSTSTETSSLTILDATTTSTTATDTLTTSITVLEATTTSSTSTDITTTSLTVLEATTTSTTSTNTLTTSLTILEATTSTSTTSTTTTDITTTSTTTSTTQTFFFLRLSRTTSTSTIDATTTATSTSTSVTTTTTTTTSSSTEIDDETSTRTFVEDFTTTETTTLTIVATATGEPPAETPTSTALPPLGNGNEPFTGGGWEEFP